MILNDRMSTLRRITTRIIEILNVKLEQERELQADAKLSFKRHRESIEREIKLLVDKRGLLATNQDHLERTIMNCKEFILTDEEWEKVMEE